MRWQKQVLAYAQFDPVSTSAQCAIRFSLIFKGNSRAIFCVWTRSRLFMSFKAQQSVALFHNTSTGCPCQLQRVWFIHVITRRAKERNFPRKALFQLPTRTFSLQNCERVKNSAQEGNKGCQGSQSVYVWIITTQVMDWGNFSVARVQALYTGECVSGYAAYNIQLSGVALS